MIQPTSHAASIAAPCEAFPNQTGMLALAFWRVERPIGNEKARTTMATTAEEAIAVLQDDRQPTNKRETAVHYLQHNPSQEGTAALVAGLRDRDSGVRWACGSALAELGEQALEPLLRAVASTDNDPMLREGAHHALAHSTSSSVRTRTERLRQALKGPGAQLASMEEAAKLLYGS